MPHFKYLMMFIRYVIKPEFHRSQIPSIYRTRYKHEDTKIILAHASDIPFWLYDKTLLMSKDLINIQKGSPHEKQIWKNHIGIYATI